MNVGWAALRRPGGSGIRVNAVGLGAIDTPINAAWTGDPAKRTVVESHIPLGRVETPEEIAGVFAFLTSDQARERLHSQSNS